MSTVAPNEPFVFRPSTGLDAVSVAHAGTGHPASDPIVRQTRREISEIVREIAAAATQPRSTEAYVGFLCDRTVRAMAAQGMVVWKITKSFDSNAEPEPTFEPLGRLGRITDRSIQHRSEPCHRRLLLETLSSGPVVVPPTPDAIAEEIPANPTEVPVALVPVTDTATREAPSHLIEVFLEPDGGVATQRGYLRFVAQVADLAGEYFRNQHLRTLTLQRKLARQIDPIIEAIYQSVSLDQLHGLVVDSIAQLTGADRVALCEIASAQKVLAVSFVDEIDHSSAAVRTIADELHQIPVKSNRGYTVVHRAERDGEREQGHNQQQDHDSQSSLSLRAAFAGRPDSSTSNTHFRVGIYQRTTDSRNDDYSLWEDYQYVELRRVVVHGEIASSRLKHASRNSLVGLLAGHSQAERFSRLRRLVATAGVLAVLAGIMLIPVPRVIHAQANLRAESSQRISAYRDAIVDRVHVTHGQPVTAGQLLLTMTDPQLDAELTTLTGRQSVLTQRRDQLTANLVETNSSHFDRFDEVESQRQIVNEELATVGQQIKMLSEIRQTLLIHADRDGVVDGWQLRQRLLGQPVRRGDALLQVIGKGSHWIIDARVPQRRINVLRSKSQSDEFAVQVNFHDQPDINYQAELIQFGPTTRDDAPVADPSQAEALSLVLLRLARSGGDTPNHQIELQNQSPATVLFHCGSYPLGQALFGDFLQAVKSATKLYLGGLSETSE